jgi:hypothetical protein
MPDYGPAICRSDLGLLSHLERVVDLDAEVPDGTFKLGMTEQ